MATIENDLTRLSEREIRKRMKEAEKVAREIERADSREVVRSGKGDEYLSRLESAANTFTAATAELTRRSGPKRDSLQATATFNRDARQREQLNAWAMDPTPIEKRPGRPTAPDPWEPLKKAYWLLRNSLPSPLLPEDMDGVPRLSVQEGQELYDLTRRSMKGETKASEAPRWEALLEKAADRPPGSIAAARQDAAERQAQEVEDAAAEREARRQREAEREQFLAANGVPRL